MKQWGATIEETIDEVDIEVADLTRHLKEAETKEQNKKQKSKKLSLAKKNGRRS